MKRIVILKADYDELVYPCVAMSQNENIADLRIASKVLDKLEARGKHAPIPSLEMALCERCRGQFVTEPAKAITPMYQLDGISEEFAFEDAEAKYLAKQMTSWIPKLHARVARSMLPIIDALEKEYDDTGVTEDSKVATAGV